MNIPPIFRLVIGGSDMERAAVENKKESGLLMAAISRMKAATDPGDVSKVVARANDDVESSREQ